MNNFHTWCRQQHVTYHVPLPASGPRFSEELVQSLIHAVDRGQVPREQYGAVLIDEAHDFAPEWLKPPSASLRTFYKRLTPTMTAYRSCTRRAPNATGRGHNSSACLGWPTKRASSPLDFAMTRAWTR